MFVGAFCTGVCYSNTVKSTVTFHLCSVMFSQQAVLVDMEEGVVSEIMKGPLREVFDCKQLITDVSGSGNNW